MYLKRLKELREDSDKKQSEIAEILQITRQQYQLYESGKRDCLFEYIIQLAQYYEVPIDYIAELTNTTTSYPKVIKKRTNRVTI